MHNVDRFPYPILYVMAMAVARITGKEFAGYRTGGNEDRWHATVDAIEDTLPSGSGFNNGTKFLVQDSTPTRLVFQSDYHHMNENGYYTGWTHHKVVVTPSFDGFDIRVTGRDRDGIKGYIEEVFSEALRQPMVRVHDGLGWVFKPSTGLLTEDQE